MPGSLSPPDLIAYEVQVNRRDIEGEGLPVASLAAPHPQTCTFFRVFHTQVSASAQTEKPQTGPQGYSGGACRGAGCRVSGLGILGLVPACGHLSWVTPSEGFSTPKVLTPPCRAHRLVHLLWEHPGVHAAPAIRGGHVHPLQGR